ncbi:MAG: Rrf2 family transcriptional regulator [Deltaproteobacteria bacterium]|nr:Rrf2 family transcriptional regulator [Deltaproteobacteria bacterium]
MKITALEEYGLRCLLQIARVWDEGISIREISEKEGLSQEYVSKITSLLKKSKLIEAKRGVHGGYSLRKDPSSISLAEVSKALGSSMFNSEFCLDHTGLANVCVHNANCSVKSVWSVIYKYMSSVMNEVTLDQLLQDERGMKKQMEEIIQEQAKVIGMR